MALDWGEDGSSSDSLFDRVLKASSIASSRGFFWNVVDGDKETVSDGYGLMDGPLDGFTDMDGLMVGALEGVIT